MNVTLPCALLTSANGISVDSTIILLLICGILTNSFMILVGCIAAQKENSIIKGTNLQEGATSIERNKQIGGHKA